MRKFNTASRKIIHNCQPRARPAAPGDPRAPRRPAFSNFTDHHTKLIHPYRRERKNDNCSLHLGFAGSAKHGYNTHQKIVASFQRPAKDPHMPSDNVPQEELKLPQFPEYVFSADGVPRRVEPAKRGRTVGTTAIKPCRTKGGKEYYLLRDKNGKRTSVFPETVRAALATFDVAVYPVPGLNETYVATEDGFLYRKLPTGTLRALKPEFRHRQMLYTVWRDCKRTTISSSTISALLQNARENRAYPDIVVSPAAAAVPAVDQFV